MHNLKYLAAYIIPALCVYGLLAGGWAAWLTVAFAFGFIPVVEHFLPQSTENLVESERQRMLADRIFDWLLYLNIPIVFGILALLVYQLNHHAFTPAEWWGTVLSVGIVLGANGINVAHELGHRATRSEQAMAKLLLLPTLYQHFFIEHNRGHHKYVATPEDPATARKGELLYTFWLRSLWGSYLHAWKLEAERLQRAGQPVATWQNEMIRFTIQQLVYIGVVIALTPDWMSTLAVVVAGGVGVLLLESINYVEHYGLRRQMLPNGRYERVLPHHSWNANYHLGRIMLYELTRHSDHHYLASKKYQVLDHHTDALVLPLGYPGSILLAMVPPLWFGVMHQILDRAG